MEASIKRQREILLQKLDELGISYEIYEHPPAPTIEIAQKHWKFIEATHCKNIFFRNHKGNQHYLVILESTKTLNIRQLELKLRQGKLSFASEKRLKKYLGVEPGSVTPLGLINDTTNHCKIFMDEDLQKANKLSFHPLENTASLILSFADFMKFINFTANKYEFIPIKEDLNNNK
jgi:Ala-tRNA(Pro) deacylase